MRIIIAPDKFKGSMTATEAAKQIKEGVEKVFPGSELFLFPLSDGGEGLVESLAGKSGDNIKVNRVTGPLGDKVDAMWGVNDQGNTAVIEMAAASGLYLVPEDKRNPLITTTYGTGELIKAALDHGCSKLVIGIGGSATNDGGAGMAQALGANFLDHSGNKLGFGGAELSKLARIELSGINSRLSEVKVQVACDVDNPLTGPKGASHIYGPQKGATPDMIKKLDQALKNYALIIKKDLGIEVNDLPGSGAAGGLGAGLIAFLGAELRSGIELVLEAINIDHYLKAADLLITAEGKLDPQSTHGKAPVGVARRASQYDVPVLALAGSIEGSLETFHREGITASFAISDGPLSLEESISRGPELLKTQTAELLRFWKTGKPS